MAGPTICHGVMRVIFRPAIINYRSTEADVDLLVEVIRELGASLVAQRHY